jgi:hypothetical protein
MKKLFLILLTTFLFVGAAQAAVAPTIKAVSVTPTNAPAGTMFKFTAELKAPLTTGNKVKIDLGKGLAAMTGTKTSYSLSRAIYTMGAQTYKVGIYNAKNVLQGKVSSGNYTVSSVTNNTPILTLVSGEDTVTDGKVYTLQLKATDSDNNLRSITVDWKDGSTTETQGAANDATLTFTHNYTSVGKFILTAAAKDSGTPALTSTVLSKTIDVIEPPVGKYSKVCNSGALEGEEDCPINPVLGNKATDWACTKDNETGLIWEVKTTDGGLRDWEKTYTNYTPDYPKCYWDGCEKEKDYKSKLGDSTNADGFVFDVNSGSLCGASDWRLPTTDELSGIVKLGNFSSVDTTYFPNTHSPNKRYNWFWSSSPYAGSSGGAWYVYFGDGYSDRYFDDGYLTAIAAKIGNNLVRLVRG